MDKRLRHAVVSVGIERVGKVGGGRDDGGCIRCDEFLGGYGLDCMHRIGRGSDGRVGVR
jgi:hypothetical protein